MSLRENGEPDGGVPVATHDHGTKPPSAAALRIMAIELLLIEKGLVDPAAIDEVIDLYEHRIGPRNGAKVVAKAWADPAYKEHLLADATRAIAELGFSGAQGEDMVVLENTAAIHNVVVCTLCSCYPWPVLGLPPVWYKRRTVPQPGGNRATHRAGRIRPGDCRRQRGAGVGFHRRTALLGPADASGGHRRLDEDAPSPRS